MRKIYYSLSIIFGCMSCQQNIGTYTINGTTLDSTLNGEYVYLYDYAKAENIDSVQIVNNSFKFTDTISAPSVARLKVKRNVVDVILENGEIKAPIEYKDSVSGTPLNDKKSLYLQNTQRWVEEIEQKYEDMVSSNASESELQSYIAGLDSTFIDMNIEILKQNKKNALGKYVFFDMLYSLSNPDNHISKLKSVVDDYILDFTPVKQIFTRYENLENTSAGKMFVDFTVQGGLQDGSDVKFSDYIGQGKYVLVDFWASWCGPCRRETPLINDVYNKYKSDKFDVLSVAVWDKPENTINSAIELGVNWNQIINAQSIPTELYGISGIPHIILFGPDGTIVARNLRGENIAAEVEKALKSEI